jgi:hypothetical protein
MGFFAIFDRWIWELGQTFGKISDRSFVSRKFYLLQVILYSTKHFIVVIEHNYVHPFHLVDYFNGKSFHLVDYYFNGKIGCC